MSWLVPSLNQNKVSSGASHLSIATVIRHRTLVWRSGHNRDTSRNDGGPVWQSRFMDIPAAPPASGGRGRLVRNLLLAIGLPVLFLAGCTTLVVTAVTSYFQPRPGIGFVIGDGYCEVDPATGNALVQLSVTADQTWTEDIQLEPLANKDLIVVGVASLAPGDSLQTLNEDSRKHLRQNLDDSDDWARADGDPTNIVFEFRRDSRDKQTELDTLKLWWTSGEPAFVQDVQLNLKWSQSNCSVGG